MSAEEKIEIHRGLKGVYFERSGTTFIDGKAGELRYRGYSIHDLAQHSSFEETAYLLLNGELPTAAQLVAFDAKLKAARRLPGEILSLIETVKQSHPMDVLRTAVSALAGFEPDTYDNSVEATRDKGIRLASQVPMIVAAHQAIRNGRPVPLPDMALSHAANFLWMITGRKPSPQGAQLMDRDLILHAEHGSNASSFTARVVIGTEATLHAAMTSAIAALSGPAHGGANEAALKMLEEIGTVDRIPEFVAKAKDKTSGFRLMGFGHRVYKNYDPRAKAMQIQAHAVLNEMGLHDDPLLKVAVELEKVALTDPYFIEKKLYPNIDFYSGITLKALGFPTSMFTALFALARTAGWIAQWKEMLEDPHQKIGRPRQVYTGPTERAYVPMGKRT